MDIYKINTPEELIAGNSYVGRGIVLGRTPDGRKAVTAYFIMGRSENSRNRVFALDDGVLYTRPFDESKVKDPSLIIYAALRTWENKLIVTNGDQTDTVWEGHKNGVGFHEALKARCFEPDAPNLTPRISGVVGDDGYDLSILKSEDQSGTVCQRNFFRYAFEPGVCHFIHTYEHDGDPIPTFRGEPRRLLCPEGSAEEIAEYVWNCLDESNRVSLFVRKICACGAETTAIINKHC